MISSDDNCILRVPAAEERLTFHETLPDSLATLISWRIILCIVSFGLTPSVVKYVCNFRAAGSETKFYLLTRKRAIFRIENVNNVHNWKDMLNDFSNWMGKCVVNWDTSLAPGNSKKN